MQSFTGTMERLDFRLPDFTRMSWVSDRAREVWQPRVHRLIAAWQDVELLSVAEGLRPCMRTVVDAAELAGFREQVTRHRLHLRVLEGLDGGTHYAARDAGAMPRRYRVAVGALENVEDLAAAWQRGETAEVARLAGCPACCQAFFEQFWNQDRFVDPTWPMTQNTRQKEEIAPDTWRVTGPFQGNVLLRSLGARAVPHLPCRFDCDATREQADAYLALGRGAGYADVIGWLEEMLNWPVEWSVLHGIAETKTPVVKIAFGSDASARKYTVQYAGSAYPTEGAQGLRFPYIQPEHLRVTESRSFQRGLLHPISLTPADPKSPPRQ